jgi:D-hexose-6-phosphate mutarotase
LNICLVVWNPWALGGSYGLKENDYENFLCVELGQVMDPYKIKKEQSWEYGQLIKFIPN